MLDADINGITIEETNTLAIEVKEYLTESCQSENRRQKINSSDLVKVLGRALHLQLGVQAKGAGTKVLYGASLTAPYSKIKMMNNLHSLVHLQT